MAIQNKISLETRFQLNNTPQNFRIQDTTDYASESISTSDVVGALKILDPNGNIVHETLLPLFDIDVDVQDYIDSILLPKDSNDDVLQGNYTIIYTIRVSGAVQAGDYSETFVYKFCYEEIKLDIDLTVDLINAKLTSTDNTSYPQEVTNSSRTHTVYPPEGLNPSDWPAQTVSTKANIYSKDGNKIATKTWTGKVVNILELTYSDNLIVDVTVTGDSEREIKDDINICNLQCNMRALVERYYNALGTDTVNADLIYKDQLAPSLAAAFMYTSNISCGNFDKAEEYYQDVLKFTGSQPDCQCSDSTEPQIITASGGGGGGTGGTYIVAACNENNALSVTSNTIGDTTTYTICFNQSLYNKLSTLTETNVISSDSSIDVTSSLNGYIKEYDIKVSTSLAVPSVFSGIIDINLNGSSLPTTSFRSGWSTVSGTNLQEPSIVNTISTDISWIKGLNCFYIEGYNVNEAGRFPKPVFQIVEVTKEGAIRGCSQPRFLDVKIKQIDQSLNRIYFHIQNYNNPYPLPGYELSNTADIISISVIINA